MNMPDYTNCTLCPRMCHVNRSVTTGYCGCSSHISAARAALHKWEEPVLSGPEEEPGGSGAVFFSGCTLRCCFCQNSLLSKDHFGKKLTVNELGDAFLRLQDKGAYNINLVTPTQFFPDIIKALDLVRHKLQIMDLLHDLKEKLGLTYIFITHDLTSVTYLCDDVLFLYHGRITEHIPVSSHLLP